MTTLEIYSQLLKAIESSVATASREVDIVKESVTTIQRLVLGPNIKIQAGFCHQKPYAFFVNPTDLFTKQKTELGDFLFVIKYFDNGKEIDKRALFFQAKYTKKRNPFSIELHQYHFYKQIDIIEFKFGNTVYKDSGYTSILWKNISKRNEFGDYFLLGDKLAVDIFTDEISAQYEHKKVGHFSFDLRSVCDCWHFLRQHELCCKANSPLFDFLTPFGRGNRIDGLFETFINLIYKRLGMIPDPIEEHTGFWEENSNGGFGLIEITINNNENIRE